MTHSYYSRVRNFGPLYLIDGSQTSPLTHSPLATFLLLFVINSNFLNTRSTRSFQASNSSAESSTILTFNVAPRPWRSHSLPNQEKGKATSICVSFSRPAHGQSMPKRSRPALELESTFSKLCLAQTAETDETTVAVTPLGFDLNLPALPAKENQTHRPLKLQIDEVWQDGSREDILDRLIMLATDWCQSALVNSFFRPYKENPEAHHFLKGAVIVSIPQCHNLSYRIYTVYQAVEMLYNTCMTDTSCLTAELVQLHLVQLRKVCTNITPASTTSRRQAPPHKRPPIPMSVM